MFRVLHLQNIWNIQFNFQYADLVLTSYPITCQGMIKHMPPSHLLLFPLTVSAGRASRKKFSAKVWASSAEQSLGNNTIHSFVFGSPHIYSF
jgi:hypothetical protein